MKELLDKLDEQRKKLDKCERWFRDNIDLLRPIAEECARLGGESELHDYPWLCIRISGDKHKLTEIVRCLRGHGFKTTEERPAANASSWNPLFDHEDLPGSHVYLNFSSTICRRVKVGTRVVPEKIEDVYETVCGEIELDRTDAAHVAEDLPF